MSAILFDQRTGQLRIKQAAFDCIVACARGDENPGAELPALRAAGAVEAGAPHRALSRALRAVTAPICRLQITLTDELGRCKAGDGWIDPHTAALLLDLPDGLRDLVTLTPEFVPAAIARTVWRGPRPRANRQQRPFGAELLEDTLSADPDARRRALEALADQIQHLAGGRGIFPKVGGEDLHSVRGRTWLADMSWAGRLGAPFRRRILVLDHPAGLFVSHDDHGEARVWPTTSTAIWRQLIRLLPDTEELAGRSTGKHP